jgi:phosphoribosylformylglycinamidine cyclo-ligase
LGLSSTGVHSNGFSLVRKLISNLDEKFVAEGKDTGKTIGEVLLSPTRIYVKPVMEVLEKFRDSVHGMVHITGGGFYENIPRMFAKSNGNDELVSVIHKGSWEVPPIFDFLAERGADKTSMFNTFNMGIGFVLAVKNEDSSSIIEMFNSNAKKYHVDGLPDMKAYVIGRVSNASLSSKGRKELVIFED